MAEQRVLLLDDSRCRRMAAESSLAESSLAESSVASMSSKSETSERMSSQEALLLDFEEVLGKGSYSR